MREEICNIIRLEIKDHSEKAVEECFHTKYSDMLKKAKYMKMQKKKNKYVTTNEYEPVQKKIKVEEKNCQKLIIR